MEPPSPYRILIRNDSGRRPRTEAFRKAVAFALADRQLPAGELSVRLTDDESIRDLNRAYRGVDLATDVLTFPVDDIPLPRESRRPLGDVVISIVHAERQARQRGYGRDAELAYLGIHAVLHLAGLDDETEGDRRHMLAEMARLGEACGLPPLGDWHTMAPEEAGTPAGARA